MMQATKAAENVDSPYRVLKTSSYFRWSREGWFGAQVGSSVWLLVSAVYFRDGQNGMWSSGICLAAFIGMNAIGCLLWWRRDRISPHRGIQILLAVSGGVGLVIWTLITQMHPELIRELSLDTFTGYKALLIVPALMLLFWTLERLAWNRRFASSSRKKDRFGEQLTSSPENRM